MKNTIKSHDVVKRLSSSLHIKDSTITRMLEELAEIIAISLANGDRVSVKGLGIFYPMFHNSRIIFGDKENKLLQKLCIYDEKDCTFYFPEGFNIRFKPSENIKGMMKKNKNYKLTLKKWQE